MARKQKLIILLVAVIFAILYDWLFPSPNLGINFSVFMFWLLILAVVLRLVFIKKLANAWSLLFCIPILWYAGSVAIYQSTFVHVVAPLAAIFLFVLFLFWFGVEEMPMKKVKRIFPFSLLLFIGRFFSKMFSSFSGIGKFGLKKGSKVVIALAIVIPLVLIFGSLFAAADMIFEKWITDFFDFDVDKHNVWRVVRTISLFIFFSGVFYAYLLQKRFKKKKEDEQPVNAKVEEKKNDYLISNIVLGVLNAFFLLFIAIQVMFLFGGHEVIQKYDISYADYVHKGFYQMCAITFLVLIISYVMYRINKSKKIDLGKILTSLFVFQTLIITASALKRMFLYEQAYGLTQLRFLVWHFIVYIGLILLALLLIVLFRKHYRLFVKISLIVSIVYLMYMTGINMQAKVAKVNIDRYLAGQDKELDTRYLSRLSVDIFNQMERLKDIDDSKIRYDYTAWLNHKSIYMNKEWQSSTLSKYKFWIQ